MKLCLRRAVLLIALCLSGLAIFGPLPVSAQWPFAAAPVTPQAQRNALSALRSQIKFFQNATRTAPNYGTAGYGNVLSQFETMRGAYNGFKQTLNPRQLERGANSLAELDAGLDILNEAFTNCQNDFAAGREPSTAIRSMCQALREGSQVWAQELEKICSQLRVGFG
jgi:hypothetical protein